MKFRGAVFDFDGTLVESMGIWEKIDEKYLNSKNVEVPKGFGKTISLMTFYQVACYVVDLFGWKESPQEIYDEWFKVAMEAYETDVYLKDNVREGLTYLKNAGVKMAIASASDREIIEACLQANGIEEFFEVIVTTGEVNASKESPRIYEAAAQRLGLEYGECAVFEDILLGIQSAKQAGFKTVGVFDNHSEKDHDAMKKEADWFITDLGEICRIL